MESLFYDTKADAYIPFGDLTQEKKKEAFDAMQDNSMKAILYKLVTEDEKSATAV